MPEGERELDELEQLDPELEERRRAALAVVRTWGDPVLKTAASPVTEFDERLAAEAERMVELMHGALGVGLAATQLGVLHRMLVFQATPDGPAAALVNPEVEWSSAERESMFEGCLSLPGVMVEVERPLKVLVSGCDQHGERLRIEAAGLEARVLQHEIDHLDGVLILDRTSIEQRREALAVLRGEPAPGGNGAGPAPESA